MSNAACTITAGNHKAAKMCLWKQRITEYIMQLQSTNKATEQNREWKCKEMQCYPEEH